LSLDRPKGGEFRGPAQTLLKYEFIDLLMVLDISTIIYLPEPFNSKIDRIRRTVCKRFNAKRVLDWEPHITIANRVLLPEEKKDAIFSQLRDLCQATKPFEVKTSGFHILDIPNLSFENPYVIFIGIEVSEKLLEFHKKIQDEVFQGLERPSYKSSNYKPHITLAYRDLTKENFELAKKYFLENPLQTKYNFALDNLQLATQNKNGIWSSYQSFELGK